MPLPPTDTERTRVHQRHVTSEGFKRADGLWDIEARLLDTKDHDFPLPSGLRKNGEAIHDISVRVTIDTQMNVIGVLTCFAATPYMGYCDKVPPDYTKIIGLNLFHGFLKAVKDMFGDARGCAHMNELLMFMPTVALQTIAGEAVGKIDSEQHKPYPLDRCHALASDSEAVRNFYPRWYCQQKADAPD